MWTAVRFLLPFCLFSAVSFCTSTNSSLDADKSIAEYLLSYGYAFQEHKAVTKDGYILTLWRIPGNLSYVGPRGPPVLVTHGIFDTGFSFLFQSINKNLPIMLADHAGFDVWIGNCRGNIVSLEHSDRVNYSSSDYSGAYWDFSWDEMAKYDLPAMIEYIAEETGYQKLRYVCHSQGCAILLALSSLDLPFVNAHVQQAVMFAPAVYFTTTKSWLINTLVNRLMLISLFEALNIKDVFAQSIITRLSKFIGIGLPNFWLYLLNACVGETNEEHIDLDRIPVIAAHEIGGTSLQNVLHWTQSLSDSVFRMMDFGTAKNLQRYGQETAPVYNMTVWRNLAYSTMIFAFQNDTVITSESVQRILRFLPEGSYIFEEVPDTNHLSGYWGTLASSTIYPRVEKFLARTPC